MKHSLRAFRYRNYRLFFYGQSLSIIGNWIQQVAMSRLVYRLTGSAWLLGVTGFAGQIAVFLFAPFGGLWADRFDRRKLLIVTQATAMALAFALGALTYAERVEVWHVIVVATLFGSARRTRLRWAGCVLSSALTSCGASWRWCASTSGRSM